MDRSSKIYAQLNYAQRLPLVTERTYRQPCATVSFPEYHMIGREALKLWLWSIWRCASRGLTSRMQDASIFNLELIDINLFDSQSYLPSTFSLIRLWRSYGSGKIPLLQIARTVTCCHDDILMSPTALIVHSVKHWHALAVSRYLPKYLVFKSFFELQHAPSQTSDSGHHLHLVIPGHFVLCNPWESVLSLYARSPVMHPELLNAPTGSRAKLIIF